MSQFVVWARVRSGWMFNFSTQSAGAFLGITKRWRLPGTVSGGCGFGRMPEQEVLAENLPEMCRGWLEIPGSVSASGRVCNGQASLQEVIVSWSKELLAPLRHLCLKYPSEHLTECSPLQEQRVSSWTAGSLSVREKLWIICILCSSTKSKVAESFLCMIQVHLCLYLTIIPWLNSVNGLWV